MQKWIENDAIEMTGRFLSLEATALPTKATTIAQIWVTIKQFQHFMNRFRSPSSVIIHTTVLAVTYKTIYFRNKITDQCGKYYKASMIVCCDSRVLIWAIFLPIQLWSCNLRSWIVWKDRLDRQRLLQMQKLLVILI